MYMIFNFVYSKESSLIVGLNLNILLKLEMNYIPRMFFFPSLYNFTTLFFWGGHFLFGICLVAEYLQLKKTGGGRMDMK